MTSFDEIAGDLQALRVAAGSPSYAEIALRITKLREGRGEQGARPARTTVYDAFRPGRRRLDTALVLDIVRALGADEAEVEGWAERCRTARASDPPAPATPVEPPVEVPAEPVVEPAAAPTPEPAAPLLPPPLSSALLLCLGCLALNMLGRFLVVELPLPIYLDMVGTAVSAVVLGPWWGALVGVATNLTGVGISGWESAAFAVVNIAGALVWGYGVRRWRMGLTFPRFAALNVIVAVICTALAVPIIVALDGVTGHGADTVTAAILKTVDELWLAVASANILTSLADKVIGGFVVLVAVDVLPRRLVARVRPLMPLAAVPSEPPLRSTP